MYVITSTGIKIAKDQNTLIKHQLTGEGFLGELFEGAHIGRRFGFDLGIVNEPSPIVPTVIHAMPMYSQGDLNKIGFCLCSMCKIIHHETTRH